MLNDKLEDDTITSDSVILRSNNYIISVEDEKKGCVEAADEELKESVSPDVEKRINTNSDSSDISSDISSGDISSGDISSGDISSEIEDIDRPLPKRRFFFRKSIASLPPWKNQLFKKAKKASDVVKESGDISSGDISSEIEDIDRPLPKRRFFLRKSNASLPPWKNQLFKKTKKASDVVKEASVKKDANGFDNSTSW
eukprot:CAMPEP_0194194154 /NCGR_PEP_ID=MMETSP0154-20130528/75430_1 /TAXON_ID=1049557 /ORGANISM="Thalassiothrix antarctica, Strain L6-D1" /LENGTH=197 /DNA_ID=CAMNT_0038918557 /DNA_START=36 /DNA_END=626 /DNA_ORIENTATION=+